MGYVGLATSIGLVIDIPIVVRSLADSLVVSSDDALPLTIDIGFMKVLAAGTNVDEFGRVVNSYQLPWWEAQRKPVDAILLGPNTVKQCLDHHRIALLRRGTEEILPIVTDPIFLPSLPMTATDSSCPSCERNCKLAMMLFTQVKSLKNITSAMVTSKKVNQDTAVQEASASFVLHGKAQSKESETQTLPFELPDPYPGETQTACVSCHIWNTAMSQLVHGFSTASPAPESKWIGGPHLTKKEVLALVHIDHIRQNTAYGLNMPTGGLPGNFSSTNSSPGNIGDLFSVSASVTNKVPPTHHESLATDVLHAHYRNSDDM